MIRISAFNHIEQDDSIFSMYFRYAVLAKVLGVKLPENEDIELLSEDSASTLYGEKHTVMADRILFLFGAGVLDEDTATALIVRNDENLLDDILAAESKVFADNAPDVNDADKMPYEMIQKILLCAAMSKRYSEVQSVSFEEARTIAGLPHIQIVGGLVKIPEEKYFNFLVKIGEKFGFIQQNGSVFTEDREEYLLGDENVKSHNAENPGYPFVLNLKNLLCYAAVWDKVYGQEFIEYAKNNSIPLNDSFERRYGEYISREKLSFKARGYKRKRFICGSKINWFDYAAYSDGGFEDKLKPDKELPITLTVSETLSDKELLDMAVKRFIEEGTPDNNTVFEIYHGSEVNLFIWRKKTAVPLDVERFHTMLFDFNNIWSIIQECSRKHEIKMMNGKIVIPENMYAAINPEEREFADNLIREQYMRMIENRKNNAIIQTLSEITNQAAEDRKKIDGANSDKEAEQQRIAEKNANRKPSTENTGGKK